MRGVDVLEVHPVDEPDYTAVLAEVLFVLALFACHLHVHATMSVLTGRFLDLDSFLLALMCGLSDCCSVAMGSK